MFNSARRDSGGLLSMVILRFDELESEAMEGGVGEENKYYLVNKVDHRKALWEKLCFLLCFCLVG